MFYLYLFTVQPAGAYWVLDTDYDTYSLVWSCSDIYFARAGTVLTVSSAHIM